MPKFPIKIKNQHGPKYDYEILSCQKKTVPDESDSNVKCKKCEWEVRIKNIKNLKDGVCLSCGAKDLVKIKQAMLSLLYYKVKVGNEIYGIVSHEVLSKEILDDSIKNYINKKK